VIREFVEFSAGVIELVAVAVILFAVLHGTGRYLLSLGQLRAGERFKQYIGKAMLLGLELLVAADIVETVTLDKTLESAILLAVLVVVRTFLSWSLVVEIEGRWPWQPRETEPAP
jgi:uncharacterized membrane protein